MSAKKPESEKRDGEATRSQRQSRLPTNDKVAADTARYEALAREHGADLSEEQFSEILAKVTKPQKS